MTQVIKLEDKDIKTTVITMFHMFKEVEGMSILRKEKERLKKSKVELLHMKNTIFEMKTQNCYGNYNFCHYFYH